MELVPIDSLLLRNKLDCSRDFCDFYTARWSPNRSVLSADGLLVISAVLLAGYPALGLVVALSVSPLSWRFSL